MLGMIFFLSAAVVGATVKLYTATGENYANEIGSQDISKLRARDKAVKNATKQAGVYLKTYSRSVNSELTDDEITAITSNAWQLVGKPKYSREIVKRSDETSIIVWKKTVKVNIDDSALQNRLNYDYKEVIISQTLDAKRAAEENDRLIKDLRKKYSRATSRAERDFLSKEKLEEVNRLYYSKNYNGAIKLYNETIKLNLNNILAYYVRRCVYDELLKQ